MRMWSILCGCWQTICVSFFFFFVKMYKAVMFLFLTLWMNVFPACVQHGQIVRYSLLKPVDNNPYSVTPVEPPHTHAFLKFLLYHLLLKIYRSVTPPVPLSCLPIMCICLFLRNLATLFALVITVRFWKAAKLFLVDCRGTACRASCRVWKKKKYLAVII